MLTDRFSKASDIDVVYIFGYGFPVHRGGPLNYANEVGLFNVAAAMKRFAPAVFTVGTLSFCYHATNVHVTQVLDFLAMYIFCYLLLLINVQRLGLINGSAMRVALLGSSLLSTALTAGLVRIGFPIQSLIAALTLAIVVTELLLYRRQLLAEAERLGGDCLLIGAFHHGMIWDAVFGGVTRDVLASARLPVFLRS